MDFEIEFVISDLRIWKIWGLKITESLIFDILKVLEIFELFKFSMFLLNTKTLLKKLEMEKFIILEYFRALQSDGIKKW